MRAYSVPRMLRSGISRLSRPGRLWTRANVRLDASHWATVSDMNDYKAISIRVHPCLGHRLGRFLSSQRQAKVIDLTAVWLQSLKLAWRLERYDAFTLEAKNAYIQWRGPGSRKSLESAAAAVQQAHADATFVSRSVGSNEREVISAVEYALNTDGENIRGLPGLPAADAELAERMERLRSAGVLDALLSAATVRYLRAKQASEDFDMIQSRLEELLDHDVVARQKEEDWQQKETKLEAEGKRIRDDQLLRVGLLDKYRPGMFGTMTWTPEQIEDWCSKSEAAGYRTACGRTAADFIRSTCHIRPDMKSDDDCKEAASRIVEATQVLVHAMVVAGSVPLSDAHILSGVLPPLWGKDPESHRDRVLFSAIDAVMNTLAGYPNQDMNNKLVVGAKGVGKSSLLKSIGVAMAMIEFANPDVIICTVYVNEPCAAVPEAYLAAAMHARGVLPGDDGQLPPWCDAKSEPDPNTRQINLESWIKEWRKAKGKLIIPILLLDEVAEMRNLGVEVADRFIRHVRAIAENRGTVALRLTGTWSETPNFLYNRPERPVLNYHKTVKQSLQNTLSTVEAQLMCLYGNPGRKPYRGIAIARAVAKRMLEDDQLFILRKHGFLSRYPLMGTDGSSEGNAAVLITMGDAKRWREADPDWEQHAQEGERLVEVLRHASASIPRFLARPVDESVSDMLADRLRADLSNDRAFAHFAGWLQRQILAQGRRSLQLSEEEFVKSSGVPVSDENVLESLRVDPMDRRSVSEFLEMYNEHGHIVTETDSSNLSTARVVRFSSKLFLLIANAHLNHVGDNLHTLEFNGLHDASGNAAQDPVEGLVAEGLALNGLGVIGQDVGLEGTLGFRRLDCGTFLRSLPLVGPENRDTKRIAGLERLDLKAIAQAGAGIPLNTILKEAPDRRKADLVAVCAVDSSDEAVVIRAQVTMGRIPDKRLKDAKILAASWDRAVDGHDPVVSQLAQASNLRHIKKWTHLPLWLSAVDPSDREEMEAAGVKVVSGEEFWRMAIPAVQLAVTGLYKSSPQLSEDEKSILLSQLKRPTVYEACVLRRDDSDLQGGNDEDALGPSAE